MGRLDWKRGRFDTDFETNEINNALRGHQASQIGDTVQYWRFDRVNSEINDVYDEGFGAGRVYRPPVELPCLHVTHDEGGGEANNTGFYWNDNIYISCSYEQFTRTGLTEADVHHQGYLRDRILYDGLVFRVTDMHVVGQIQQRDLIVSIEGTQVKPDEMANDPQFVDYAQYEPPNR